MKSGWKQIVDALTEGPKTVDQLMEITSLKKATIKIQLKYHLVRKGYILKLIKQADKIFYSLQGEPDAKRDN